MCPLSPSTGPRVATGIDPPLFVGAVLLGGGSRRMGEDKASLVLANGEMLGALSVAALDNAGCSRIMGIGGTPELSSQLGIEHVPDQWPGQGPLGALVTALAASYPAITVLLPCDLPLADASVVEQLLQHLDGDDAESHCAIPRIDGHRAFVTSVWTRDCLAALQRSFDSGGRSIRGALSDLHVIYFEPAAPRPFFDADTPEELHGLVDGEIG
jgi:molybdopterin-guanine dinucleotide biosynthesis protein A